LHKTNQYANNNPYIHLFQSLNHRYTPEGHPELEETKEALEKISSVAKANDASIGMTEELRANHEQMVDTMMSFTWVSMIFDL